jgi:hypothetical protein
MWSIINLERKCFVFDPNQSPFQEYYIVKLHWKCRQRVWDGTLLWKIAEVAPEPATFIRLLQNVGIYVQDYTTSHTKYEIIDTVDHKM